MRKLRRVVAGIALATLYGTGAFAVLGEPEASVSSDSSALSAAKRSARRNVRYTLHELESDGVKVREFVSPSGTVFAVAWNGMKTPDLTRLLGSYADEYKAAAKRSPRVPGRRSRQVDTGRVVVERWGHMRNLQGRAYVPALVPPEVKIEELR